MNGTLTITGERAVLKWGYLEAAELSAWAIAADGVTLTATVISSHALRVTQAPLTFEVPRPNGPWTWPIISLQITGQSLSATIGA